VLDLDANKLTSLPTTIGNMHLEILKVAYNRLGLLHHDAFRPNLCNTLKSLWLTSNNLLELPDSISDIVCLDDVHVDGNPILNPPAALVADGIHAIKQYCRQRGERLKEILTLITAAGFETDIQRLVPQADGVLMNPQDTGYLTNNDLQNIDSAVDRYVNKDYYKHALSAKDLVSRVIHLRKAR
jgi:Leucine-rich repeat (LRR) protein